MLLIHHDLSSIIANNTIKTRYHQEQNKDILRLDI